MKEIHFCKRIRIDADTLRVHRIKLSQTWIRDDGILSFSLLSFYFVETKEARFLNIGATLLNFNFEFLSYTESTKGYIPPAPGIPGPPAGASA